MYGTIYTEVNIFKCLSHIYCNKNIIFKFLLFFCGKIYSKRRLVEALLAAAINLLSIHSIPNLFN